ncbi:MAG TPA: DNA gyrase subunit A, partial [Aliicoccus persicus]|nr:DNA gyrase subunit A [Aliicoccus persicus]
ILVITDKGYGKITPEEQYRVSRRGGRGVKTATLTERNGQLVYIAAVQGDEDLMIVTDHGVIIRLLVEDISVTGRATQGVRLIRLMDDQRVATVTTVKDVEEELKEVEKETDSGSGDEGGSGDGVAGEAGDEGGGMEDAEFSLENEVDKVEEDLDPESSEEDSDESE